MTSIVRVFVVMAFGVSVRHSAVRRRDDTASRGAHDDAEDHGGCDHGHCHGYGRGRDVGSRRARARSVTSFARVVVVMAFGVGVRCLAVPRRRRRRSRARAPQRHLCEWARTIAVGSGGGSGWVHGRSL